MTELIEELRAAVLAADPRIVENVKWNSPNFTLDGQDRVTLRANPKGGVQVILHRGAKKADGDFRIDDPSGRLTWPSNDRAILAVTEPGDADLVTDLVRRWTAH